MDELDSFSPLCDDRGEYLESESDFVRRVATNLPNWPRELVIEWLYRHVGSLEKYAFLFRRLSFVLEKWPLNSIPDREAFDNPAMCDSFRNVKERAERVPRFEDWSGIGWPNTWSSTGHGTRQ